jgi:hypothetical protein
MSAGSFEHFIDSEANAAFKLRPSNPMSWALRSSPWRCSKDRARRTRTTVFQERAVTYSLGKGLAANWVSWLTLIIKLFRRSD